MCPSPLQNKKKREPAGKTVNRQWMHDPMNASHSHHTSTNVTEAMPTHIDKCHGSKVAKTSCTCASKEEVVDDDDDELMLNVLRCHLQSGKDFLYLCFKRGGGCERFSRDSLRSANILWEVLAYHHIIWKSWLLAGQCPQVWPGTAAAGCEAGRYLYIWIHIYTSNTVCTGNEDTRKYRFTSAIQSAQVMKIPAHTHLHHQYGVHR